MVRQLDRSSNRFIPPVQRRTDIVHIPTTTTNNDPHKVLCVCTAETTQFFGQRFFQKLVVCTCNVTHCPSEKPLVDPLDSETGPIN